MADTPVSIRGTKAVLALLAAGALAVTVVRAAGRLGSHFEWWAFPLTVALLSLVGLVAVHKRIEWGRWVALAILGAAGLRGLVTLTARMTSEDVALGVTTLVHLLAVVALFGFAALLLFDSRVRSYFDRQSA
jgi:hypothetical protein